MKAANKRRRSQRIPARHNIMLMVDGADGALASKEVVTTVHISQHGAHLLGRRRLDENCKGKVANLSTCRQAPFRIAWQTPSASQPGFHEIGIEFEGLTDFWGTAFIESPKVERTDPLPRQTGVKAEPGIAESTNGDLLDMLRNISPGPEGRAVTEAIWCGLVEQMEERRIFTRRELIASLRKVGLQIT